MIPKIDVDGIMNWAMVGLVLTAVIAVGAFGFLMYYVIRHIRFI